MKYGLFAMLFYVCVVLFMVVEVEEVVGLKVELALYFQNSL